MRTLVIECASEACSVALFEGRELLAHDHRILGRGHAEQLVPMIKALPEKGKAGRILVSRGPGSFTGVRIGIAAARALAIAWGAEVETYPTLANVATLARQTHRTSAISAAMRAGHGEFFVQDFDEAGLPQSEASSLVPAASAAACRHNIVAGTMAQEIVNLRGSGTPLVLHPDARCVPDIPALLFSPLMRPDYARGPDAKLPRE